jgi:hypothetical protein
MKGTRTGGPGLDGALKGRARTAAHTQHRPYRARPALGEWLTRNGRALLAVVFAIRAHISEVCVPERPLASGFPRKAKAAGDRC